VAATLAGAAVLAGCGATSEQRAYEYMPDMARSPSYKAFAPNSATRDGLTLQHPVAGTIPRGYHVFHYGPGEDEAARAGRELQDPYRATHARLKKEKHSSRRTAGLPRRARERRWAHLGEDPATAFLCF